MKYTLETKWGSHIDCIPTVYTYTFESGMVFVKEESKNIVNGHWTNKIRVTMPGQKQRASTVRSLRMFTEAGEHVTELPSKPTPGSLDTVK